MRLDEAIRSRGFRRWYERQLYVSHAYLVAGLLALIMMALAIEMVEFRRSIDGLLILMAIGGGGAAVCVISWRKFSFLLARAEYVASRATCPACGVYAKFKVDGAEESPEAIDGRRIRVHCRGCSHPWTIA